MSPAVPKPAARVKVAKKPLKRGSPIKAGKPLAKSTKPLKKAGTTKAKKVARQRVYYASAAWKAKREEVLERAGRQCEYQYSAREILFAENILQRRIDGRCQATKDLHVHHRTYLRWGGKELPKDMMALCKEHHDLVETRDFPHRQRTR